MALPFPPPASLDSSFTMSRPTEADIDAMTQVYFDAFKSDLGNTYWWSPDRDAMYEWLWKRIEGKMRNRNVRHFQILDNTSSSTTGRKEAVAFARWDIPKGYEAAFGEWIGKDDALDVSRVVMEEEKTAADGIEKPVTAADVEEAAPGDAKTIAPPRGADPELCRYLFGTLAILSKKWNAEEMLGLSLLCTSPKYHRRGAAKALLLPMLAIADAAGLRSYLEATPAGRPIYEKLGYRTVEVKEFDLTALTGGKSNGIFKLSIMIREPQSS
ncbi:hypothetical protein HD806DRAFT_122043 [Xylariaceae sp. AK1471]|nr:hypothetical protein HD806DRAFT_122043 [Xylariaceae sp. AK1471]